MYAKRASRCYHKYTLHTKFDEYFIDWCIVSRVVHMQNYCHTTISFQILLTILFRWFEDNETKKKNCGKKSIFQVGANTTKPRETHRATHTRAPPHTTPISLWSDERNDVGENLYEWKKKIRKSICASCVLSSTKLEFFLFRLYAFLHFFFCFRSTSVWLVNWRCSRQYAWMRTIVINVCMKGDEKCQRWEKSCTHVNLCSASCKNLNTEHGEQRTQTCMQMELISNQGKNVCG